MRQFMKCEGGCGTLVHEEYKRCANCGGLRVNCIVCGTGASHWLSGVECMYGHSPHPETYASDVELLATRVAHYSNPRTGGRAWKAVEMLASARSALESALKEESWVRKEPA